MLTLAVLTTAILGGCETRRAELERTLPDKPDYWAPIAKPELHVGMDAQSALVRTDAALDQANARLEKSPSGMTA